MTIEQILQRHKEVENPERHLLITIDAIIDNLQDCYDNPNPIEIREKIKFLNGWKGKPVKGYTHPDEYSQIHNKAMNEESERAGISINDIFSAMKEVRSQPVPLSEEQQHNEHSGSNSATYENLGPNNYSHT